MANAHAADDLYHDCLAAMVASGDAYPCDMLAPIVQADCALPDRLSQTLAAGSTQTGPMSYREGN